MIRLDARVLAPRVLAALLVTVGCSADKINSPTTGPISQWVVDAITVPTTSVAANGFAYDLNGDGQADNALGNALAALTSSGFDIQAAVDSGVASGAIVQLLQFQTDDSLFNTDAAAAATWYVGQPTAGFTTGAHQIDGGQPASAFVGALANRDYSSADPAKTTKPVGGVVPLRMITGTPTIYLPMNGMHVQWHFSSTPTIASGVIQGSIRINDVNNVLIPQLANAFNVAIQADTSSTMAHQIESLFDTGGCGTAAAGDGFIDACEVQNSSLMQSLLAPDVQIYDASGNYKPNPANTTPDAISFGFGFTAVRTTF